MEGQDSESVTQENTPVGEDEDALAPLEEMEESDLEQEIDYLFTRYLGGVCMLMCSAILLIALIALQQWNTSALTALAILAPLMFCLFCIVIMTHLLAYRLTSDPTTRPARVGFIESYHHIFRETPMETMLVLPSERISALIRRYRELTGELESIYDQEKSVRKASRLRFIGQLLFNWGPKAIFYSYYGFILLLLTILVLAMPWVIWNFIQGL